jgi:hypothetical protein
MALGAECPVINHLQLGFSMFTCNFLGSQFGRLVFKQTLLFGQEVCYMLGQPTRYNYLKMLRDKLRA